MLKKFTSFVFAFALVVVLCTPGLASGMAKQINVNYGIFLEFNEHKMRLTDSAGNPVEPFVYNGTTYVPIRAVSNLFGADIGYDQQENCAYIYDDQAEANAVVNRMRSVATDCYLFADHELFDVSTTELTDYREHFSACDLEIKYIISITNVLAEDNSAVAEISDQLLQKFTEYANSIADMNEKYEDLRTNQTSYYAKKFSDAFNVVMKQYYALMSDIDNYFEQYCWRDLDNILG